ncbi:maleylpyruvate isomerase family mycothiol-dependent enzyme [Nocardioides daphniae]|uniref:maleylpyruvate isomerase family mycothiol-dependent enzyme n=1 Tax=Nocardioides daphniae TaxID=402297 RepID=UPI0018816728|nr:maleylpyruvate isomerase family mycothiol-dependent enzyme [Nocardioides daphniae]
MTNLTPYVDIWWSAIADFTLLLEDLPESAWSLPTDLPGWTVRDVAAHTAHLEHLLSGGAHDDVELGEVPHARGFMGVFTEQGVVARRDRSHDDLIREIRESATATHTALLADGTPDPEAPARDPFGAIGWTSTTLWKNRPLDLWMHEQDVRRAVDLPGHLDTPGARHTVDYLSDSLGLVLAKRAKAAPGTTLRLDVEGRAPRAWVVNDRSRRGADRGARRRRRAAHLRARGVHPGRRRASGPRAPPDRRRGRRRAGPAGPRGDGRDAVRRLRVGSPR